MSNKILLPSLAIALFILLGYVLVPFHRASGTAKGEFALNLDNTDLRRKLLFGNTLENCVAANCGEVVHKNWTNWVFELGKVSLSPNWSISADGVFTVKSCDEDLGSQFLVFRQKIYVTKDSLVVDTQLVDSNGGPLEQYKTLLTISRKGDKSLVEQKAFIQVGRRLPINMIETMNIKVQLAAENSLSRQKEALTAISLQPNTFKFNLKGKNIN